MTTANYSFSTAFRTIIGQMQLTTQLINGHITNRFDAADDAFFGRIINNSSHVMRSFLHERLSKQYNLRSRHHDFILINKTNLLTDNSFIIRMLYKNCY